MKIINYFIDSYNKLYSINKDLKKKIVQIQVLLQQRESFYKLQIVYCGKTNFKIEQLFKDVFNEQIKKCDFDEIALATVSSKNEQTGENYEQTEHVFLISNNIVLANKKVNQIAVRSYWDEFICVTLKDKIQIVDIEMFQEQIKNHIREQKPNYSKIRFIFMKDGVQIMEDSLDSEIMYCHAIASAMATMAENSLNEEFRKQCLSIWHAHNPQEMNKKVFGKLIGHLENKLH